ncbi:MAG: DUF1772 domain-containing protein [Myxococcales bacterium]|nr:DUF1772 domain-containing protein [Myxococcales bacterium]
MSALLDLSWPQAALLVSAVAAGLSGGCTFVFSNFVMPALGRLERPEAIRAMQAINEDAINPLFLLIFIGTGAAVVALSAAHGWLVGPNGWLYAGTVLYAVGVVGITVFGNVPLNDALAQVDASSPAADWLAYARPWTALNTARTVAAALASACFVLAALR